MLAGRLEPDDGGTGEVQWNLLNFVLLFLFACHVNVRFESNDVCFKKALQCLPFAAHFNRFVWPKSMLTLCHLPIPCKMHTRLVFIVEWRILSYILIHSTSVFFQKIYNHTVVLLYCPVSTNSSHWHVCVSDKYSYFGTVKAPLLNVSYKPQKISPKSQGTVRQMLHEKIRDSYIHPQFITDVIKPLQVEQLYDQEVQPESVCLCSLKCLVVV